MSLVDNYIDKRQLKLEKRKGESKDYKENLFQMLFY